MRISDFTRVRRLGRGGEGTVWLEHNNHTGEDLACKDMKARKIVEDKPKEVWIRNDCMVSNHQNLVDLVGWCFIPPARRRRQKQRCNIYYEYCAGGNLRKLIPRRRHPETQLSESFIWHVFIQLAEALDAMHRRGPQHVVHRDVKPENVFLTSTYRPHHSYPTVKLGDYGLATTAPNTAATSCTWEFVGPEMELSAKGDIWALGALIHELCHGFGPVRKDRRGWKRDPRARKPKDLPSRYSDALHHQVMSCLRASRDDRPDSETLVRRLHRERPRPQPRAH